MSSLDRRKTPQELEELSKSARRRFRALVRLVTANRRWLEDVEDEQLSKNVKKNVQMLTRKKGKKRILSLQQKAILCKPAEWRTEQEKILLNRIIGGLKCFRKYPEHVKMQLAGVSYFVYYGPGRVIVRQNHEAHALYFIITGEVTVSITTIDPVLKEQVTVNVGTMVAGSMFGEVSLLHDIPRTATITTATPCELLCLKKADFDIVLKASVKEQWDEIQKAMSRFSYFQGWDEVAVRECCIYSKIKPFVRDQTILGDGAGIPSSTYFILKGQCKLIEHVLVRTSRDSTGKKKYHRYHHPVIEVEVEEEEEVILDEKKKSVTSLPRDRKRSIFTPANVLSPIPSSSTSKTMAKLKSRGSTKDNVTKRRKSVESNHSQCSGQGDLRTDSRRETVTSESHNTAGGDSQSLKSSPRVTDTVAQNLVSFRKTEQLISATDLPSYVETHFMQVCAFSETACFGLGENMKRRRVVAMSDYVECLLIPRYWLFQHNKANMWTRIQQYLDSQIPTTDVVLQEFLGQRKWMDYRSKLVKSIFRKPPVTDYHNIPYSIRINEDIRFDE